jgi:hypothetical protein
MGDSRLFARCRAAASLSMEAQWPYHRAPSVGIQLAMCALMFKSSHRPWETDICVLLAGWRCLCLFRHGHDNVFLDLREYSWRCARSRSKFPIAPMGNSCFAHCLQGGGVHVSSNTRAVTITSSSIYGNTAQYVRAHVQKFPSPRWETHVLLLVYTGRWCDSQWRLSVNRELPDLLQPSSICARSSSKFPIARWDNC